MRTIETAVVHCSATPPSMDKVDSAEIRKWHVEENGWSDIGYHYIIPRDGRLQLGRPLNRAGAHVLGHNEKSIGICLVGGVDNNFNPDFNYTIRQMRQLVLLLNNLQHEWELKSIYGHRDLDSSKSCPCFDVPTWYYG